jgi:hypothetical protein
MNTRELQDMVSKIKTTRIVSEQRGSWKWQDAYSVAEYRSALADNGRVVWRSYQRGYKRSKPQLGETWFDYDHGSLHNRPVARSEAIKVLGISRVRMIERRGWSFSA